MVMEQGDVANAVRQLAQRAQEANPSAGREYMGADGLLYCGVCHEPVQQRIRQNIFFPNGVVPCPCKCMRELMARERAEEESRRAQEYAAELRRRGFTDPAYAQQTFTRDNGSSPAARTAANWYVDNFSQLRQTGKGLLLMGGTGTGKTFYACCIANALMDKGVSVWVTTVQPLLRMAGDYGTAEDIFARVKNVDVLVLDDFGACQSGARNVELLFEIIDTRYRSGLPLIITTNLRPTDMRSAPIELERIYSRVKQMCVNEHSPIIMDGADLRERAARENHKKGN